MVDGEAVVRETNSDAPHILGTLNKGDFFGEMALIAKSIRSANVEAKTSCDLLRISHKIILDLAGEYGELRSSLEKIKAERSGSNLKQDSGS